MMDGGGGNQHAILEETPVRASNNSNSDDNNGEDDGVSISPIYQYASIFLIVITLLQAVTTSHDEPGPIDWFAEIMIPRMASMGIKGGMDPDEFGFGGQVCPPDQWVDPTFDQVSEPNGAGLYSSKYDPRSKVTQPLLFPHCALRRWVQMENEHDCPAGQEYVTVILPPIIRQAKGKLEGKIPKILHISSPTNCLPTKTIETLRKLIHEHVTQSYTIYVHSAASMDHFLFQREWEIFPEVKEGALCGSGKLMAVAKAAMGDDKMKVDNTTMKEQIAHEVGLGVKRDIWRLMVLWEYGGITVDIEAVYTILEGGGKTQPSYDLAVPSNNTTDNGGYNAMKKLMRQWSAETSDAMIYFINNSDKQRLPFMERIPFTDLMGASANHPVVYYAAKTMLRTAIKDDEKPITDVGRTTKVPPIKEGLHWLGGNEWKHVKTGQVLHMNNEKKNSVRFLDGDIILPPLLTSPRTTPWRSIFATFKLVDVDGKVPSEDDVNVLMRKFAKEQKYIAPATMFSCMEYTLDMYLHQKTTKKKEDVHKEEAST